MRYFLVIGLGVFLAYWRGLMEEWILLFMGPILYLASLIKNLFGKVLSLETGSRATYFGLILPMTLLYFGLISFFLKKLWAERGLIKVISILGLAGFLGYIHYTAWMSLQGYFHPPY